MAVMFGTGGGAAAFIDERFKQMDRNGNGVLEFDEMSETLQAERDKWDTNKDGFIDLAEFKVYVAARFPQGMGQGGQPGGAFPGGLPANDNEMFDVFDDEQTVGHLWLGPLFPWNLVRHGH